MAKALSSCQTDTGASLQPDAERAKPASGPALDQQRAKEAQLREIDG